jgi:hypothetical protein
MESISYSVTDLSSDQRHAFEGVLGQPLRDDQRVFIHVADQPAVLVGGPNSESLDPQTGQHPPKLPDWVTIFADLSDQEIAELESAILDRSESRPTGEI